MLHYFKDVLSITFLISVNRPDFASTGYTNADNTLAKRVVALIKFKIAIMCEAVLRKCLDMKAGHWDNDFPMETADAHAIFKHWGGRVPSVLQVLAVSNLGYHCIQKGIYLS